MGGDDSQKLLPWRGICSSPGRSYFASAEYHFISKMGTRSESESFLFPAVCCGYASGCASLETSWLVVAGRANRHVNQRRW